MDGRSGDAVQGPQAQNETGADQGTPIGIDPIGHRIRRVRFEPSSLQNGFNPSEIIGHRCSELSDYIFSKK
jgi:hypothetical protein